MTMLRAGGLLDVLTPLSDCRQESVERWNGDLGGFVYMLNRFPQRDFGLWAFMCPINFSVSSFLVLYHSEGYHAPPLSFRLPRRGLPRPYICNQANRLQRRVPALMPVQQYS